MPTSTTTMTVMKRSKLAQDCAYSSYECTQPCLEGYSYCAKHILADPNAPYKPCAFVYNTNGRKCQNPAPKLDRRDISLVHNLISHGINYEFVILKKLK